MRFAHMNINVLDLQRSLRFYQDALGQVSQFRWCEQGRAGLK